MKDDALDHVIGGGRNGDDMSAGLRTGALEKLITKGARAGLDGAARHRAFSAFDQHIHAQSLAEPADVVGRMTRAGLKRMVVVSSGRGMACCVTRERQRCAVRTTRHGDQDTVAGRDQPGLAKPKQQRVRSRFWEGHGGAGWTRPSDNAIMSRALYHLSYGTSCAGVRLTSRLRSCLELALLDSVLGDRDALPLVHPKHSLIRTKPGCPRLRGCCNWLRRLDSNQRPSGYEPDELPLLHSAIGLYRRPGIPRAAGSVLRRSGRRRRRARRRGRGRARRRPGQEPALVPLRVSVPARLLLGGRARGDPPGGPGVTLGLGG